MEYKKQPYENLEFYKNICLLRKTIYEITKRFLNKNLRLVNQMRDAARSAKQNIREGYDKDSAGEFGHSIKISRGSLSELEGDIDDCNEDKLISEEEFSSLKTLINRTRYQIDRFIDALYKLDKLGKWKSRFKRNHY